jgi:Mg2+ and Co2+ transporter CorA
MMVIRRVPPFTQEAYDRQRAQREQQDARRQADRNLVLTHVSSTQAAIKRDQILAEIASRMQYLNTQMIELQNDLGRDVATAAAYERRQTSVPQAIQARMKDKRDQIEQMQRNIAALQKRQDDVRSSYAQIIARLDFLERNRGAISTTSSTP